MKNKPSLVLLCIDDEKIVLKVLKEQLKSEFKDTCIIESAENGESAFSLFKELISEGATVPVVISDYMMPDMTGDVLLKKIHEISPATLTVLLTGHEDFRLIRNAVNDASLYRYIHKPWDKAEMTLTVKEALKKFFLEGSLIQKNSELEKKNQDLLKKQELFYRFVPRQFLETINPGNKEDHIELGVNVEKDIVIMFVDIRSFTATSEKRGAVETFEFINEFINEEAPIISKHSGFIDKFIGDAIMAIFIDYDEALSASIEILAKNVEVNEQRKSLGKPEVNIGIALNAGLACMGTVGYQERMETTVIGNCVNICAKIEKLNKKYGTDILITDTLVNGLKSSEQFALKKVDEILLEGMQIPIILWTISRVC